MLEFWIWALAIILIAVVPFVYNIAFHPLRHFPGPTLAGGTSWWRAYVEVFRGKSLTHELFNLHEEYGDIVRIAPNELHFSKPTAFHEIYNSSNKWDKHEHLYSTTGIKSGSFSIRDYGQAKDRRGVLQPMFSKQSIDNIERLVWQQAENLSANMASIDKDKASVDLLQAFRSFALDTIMAFTFGFNVSTLASQNFQDPLVIALNSSLSSMPFMKHFPSIRKIAYAIPPSIGMNMMPGGDKLVARIYQVSGILKEQLQKILSAPEKLDEAPHQTIFHRLLDKTAYKTGRLPDITEFMDEGMTLLTAGAHTVADTLVVGAWHLTQQPDLVDELREEIKTVWPNLSSVPSVNELKQLPLLSATVKEMLRMGPMGVSFTRIVPQEGAVIAGRAIPGGTVVGMGINHVHLSETIFKDAKTFNPRRWMGTDSSGLDQWLVAFSKGPRACIGVNLAMMELNIATAMVIRRFTLTNDGTTEADMEWKECFAAFFPSRHLHAWCKPVSE